MIESVKARLRAQLGDQLKLVGGAADFQAAAENNPAATPACFVFSLGEKPEPSKFTGALLQHVQTAVSIVLVVRNLSDSNGAAAVADVEELRRKVKGVVYGWAPQEGHDPLERGDSNLLAFKNGHAWWQDIYLTAYYDRSEL